MRRFLIISCLVILSVATITAATSQLTSGGQATTPLEINGVTPSPTAPQPSPTVVPTPPAR